jgi:hypothetical protein
MWREEKGEDEDEDGREGRGRKRMERTAVGGGSREEGGRRINSVGC